MDRRNFLHSAGKLLLALATPLSGQTRAGTKSPADSSRESGSQLMLFLCGDVMTGRGIDQVLPNPGDPAIHEHYMKSALGYVEIAEDSGSRIPRTADYAYIWGEALAELARVAPDLRIVNLETSITASDDFWPGKGIHYRMHPANTPAISVAGIDCCVLANNHILDWGYDGLGETLAVLDRAGIKTAGAGNNSLEAEAPAILTTGCGRRVLVFAAGSGSGGIPLDWAATAKRAGVNLLADYGSAAVEKIAGQVETHMLAGDIIVLSIHWGGNWGYTIPDAQRLFAHRLIDEAGVDVIHGHSSHHPRGIEVYRNKPILYGCGDFLNDYEGIGGHESYHGELCLMYFISLDRAGALARLEMTPMRIRNFRLNRASDSEAEWLAKTLNRESQRLGSGVELLDQRSLLLTGL